MSLLILLIIPVLFFSFLLKAKFYNPLVITFSLWGILLFFYATLDHNLYDLTDRFYSFLFLYLLCFLVGFLLPYLLGVKRFGVKINENMYIEETNNFKIIYKISFLISFYFIIRYTTLMLSGTNIYVLTVDNKKPIDVQIMNYFNIIPLCFSFYILLFKNVAKYKFFLFLFFLSVVLTLGKMLCMQIFIGFAIVLYLRKIIKFRHIIYGFTVFLIGLIFIQSLRYDDADSSSFLSYIIKILVIYILSPLKAVDKVFNNEIYLGHGHLFGFVYRVMSKLFRINIIPKENIYTWVFVPVPTNVYTIMKNAYVDYNLTGLMLYALFIGFFWSYIYIRQKKQKALKIFFFCNLYILVIQFFDDILSGQFSYVLQTMIISFVLIRFLCQKKVRGSCKCKNL